MGGIVLLEHPFGSAIWQIPEVIELMREHGLDKCTFDQCMYGLRAKDNLGWAPAKKPTTVATNSARIAEALRARCNNRHRHASLLQSRAKKAEEYPDKLCKAIIRGMVKEVMDIMGTP